MAEVHHCSECGVRVYVSKGYSWIGHVIEYINNKGVVTNTFALCGEHYRSYEKLLSSGSL